MQVTRPAAVVVLAAGAGTRMKSVVPKVLHKMCGRSLLGHAIAAARGLDPEHLVVVVRHDPGGQQGLVVGVGVEGHQGLRHGQDSGMHGRRPGPARTRPATPG